MKGTARSAGRVIYAGLSGLLIITSLVIVWLVSTEPADTVQPGDTVIWMGHALLGVLNLVNLAYGSRAPGVRLTAVAMNLGATGIDSWVIMSGGLDAVYAAIFFVVLVLSVVTTRPAGGESAFTLAVDGVHGAAYRVANGIYVAAAAVLLVSLGYDIVTALLYRSFLYELDLLVGFFFLSDPLLNLLNGVYGRAFAGLQRVTLGANTTATVAILYVGSDPMHGVLLVVLTLLSAVLVTLRERDRPHRTASGRVGRPR